MLSVVQEVERIWKERFCSRQGIGRSRKQALPLRGNIMAYAGNGEEIHVIFNDGVARNIPVYMLDQLIGEKRIVAFRRADGWVNVGRDSLRKHQRPTNH